MDLVARRVAAFVLDIVLLFAVLAPAGLAIQRLLGLDPQSGPAIWRSILWNFSLPSWAYFVLSDHSAGGATVGKRLLRVRVADLSGGRLGWGQALVRTAVKLLPWELVHVSAFALSTHLGRLTPRQTAGLGVAIGLIAVYMAVTVMTHGRRSIDDLAARSEVERARPPCDHIEGTERCRNG